MKILNLSAYTWANGGPAHVIHDNTKVQLEMGHEVDILSPLSKREKIYPLPVGARLIPVGQTIFGKIYPDFSLETYFFLKKNLKHYDVVHIHGLWNFPGLIALLSNNKKIAKVVTIHGTTTEKAMKKGGLKKKFFWWLIQGRALKKADFIQIHNTNEKQYLEKLFGDFKHPNTQIITNGLNFETFRNLPEKGSFRAKLGISQEKLIILFFGRLHAIKGIDILMPAFNEVSTHYKNAILLFVGPDYGMLDYIKAYTTQNNLQEKVIVHGMVKGSEKIDVLVDSDIYTLPSYSESFSIATLEACASGLPIVVSSEIGFSHEINKSGIGVVAEFNPRSLANGLRQLLDDHLFRKRSGANGRYMVEHKYDLQIVTKKLVKQMENVVREKSQA